jgi:hypothetical protein
MEVLQAMTPEQITQVIQGGQWVSITTEDRFRTWFYQKEKHHGHPSERSHADPVPNCDAAIISAWVKGGYQTTGA